MAQAQDLGREVEALLSTSLFAPIYSYSYSPDPPPAATLHFRPADDQPHLFLLDILKLSGAVRSYG
jgi:hypothetical protein